MSVAQRRIRAARARATIRAWEYRQRRHAKGTWFRLRRALADAREAYVLTPAAARELLDDGARSLAVGAELEPPRTLLLVDAQTATRIAGARRIPVRLSAELLAAPALALVPFDPTASC